MNRHILFAILAISVLCMTVPPNSYADSEGTDLCHNGDNITVNGSALTAHQSHNDFEGTCEEEQSELEDYAEDVYDCIDDYAYDLENVIEELEDILEDIEDAEQDEELYYEVMDMIEDAENALDNAYDAMDEIEEAYDDEELSYGMLEDYEDFCNVLDEFIEYLDDFIEYYYEEYEYYNDDDDDYYESCEYDSEYCESEEEYCYYYDCGPSEEEESESCEDESYYCETPEQVCEFWYDDFWFCPIYFNNEDDSDLTEQEKIDKKKKASKWKKLQLFLERPSFGINYKTWQQNHDNGVVHNGVTYPVVSEWRVTTSPDMDFVWELELNMLSKHGIRYVMITPNLETEQDQNKPEMFSFVTRANGSVEQIDNTNASIEYSVDKPNKMVTLNIDGFLNDGIIKVQVFDNVGNSVMFFIHTE